MVSFLPAPNWHLLGTHPDCKMSGHPLDEPWPNSDDLMCAFLTLKAIQEFKLQSKHPETKIKKIKLLR